MSGNVQSLFVSPYFVGLATGIAPGQVKPLGSWRAPAGILTYAYLSTA
jgi:hypothetical protein